MGIAAAQTYVQQLIDQLPMPGALPNLAAYVTPPDPNVDAEAPTAYVWPSDGDESRDSQKGGTVPRNTGPGTGSGWKNIAHSMDIWVVWFGADDDDLADITFPGVMDFIMACLRTSPERPLAVDPWTQAQSWLVDIGEKMTYNIKLRALADQRYNRYDGLIVLDFYEIFQA
jgi:hypothetical protein